MKRKDFITGLGSLGLGAACAVLLDACGKKSDNDAVTPSGNNNNNNTTDFTIDLDDPAHAALNTPGGWLYKTSGAVALVIVNSGNDNFTALSRICSHASCMVNYDPASGQLPCPCHGSRFSGTGTVLNGPATLPLTSYHTSLNGRLLRIYS